MINHARTIILNEHNSIAGLATGLPYAEVIDSTFVPFTVPVVLQPFKSNLIPSGLTISNKLVYVRGIMTLIHQPLFETYIQSFDYRITYNLKDDMNKTITFDVSALMTRLDKLFTSTAINSSLFHNPNNITYLSDMYKLWSNGITPTSRIIASILAYVYKCDQVRVK